MQRSELKAAAAAVGSSVGVAAGLYGVSKLFDTFWGGNLVRAMTNVSLEVRRGEILGLLGPPGSGKSTAVRILAGKLRAMEGKAEVFGRSPRSGAAKARVGYLAERVKGRGVVAAKGLRESFEQLVGAGGDRTIQSAGAGLMQALLNNPDLLLLDDPFGGLDASGASEMKQQIRSLTRNGRTVVLTSRLLTEVSQLCDRVAVFRAGVVEAIGTLDELLAMRGAVNFLAPVLSPAMAESLIKVIRQELTKEENTAQARKAILTAAHAGSESSSVGDDLAAPKASADSINHARLDELTKPASPNGGP